MSYQVENSVCPATPFDGARHKIVAESQVPFTPMRSFSVVLVCRHCRKPLDELIRIEESVS